MYVYNQLCLSGRCPSILHGVKLWEVTRTFAVDDYVSEMTAKKPFEYGKHG